MKSVTFYEVYSLGEDGSGRRETVARFFDEKEARSLLNPYLYIDKLTIIIYDSKQDWKENNPDNIRKRALDKLTDEEKLVLNLS